MNMRRLGGGCYCGLKATMSPRLVVTGTSLMNLYFLIRSCTPMAAKRVSRICVHARRRRSNVCLAFGVCGSLRIELAARSERREAVGMLLNVYSL